MQAERKAWELAARNFPSKNSGFSAIVRASAYRLKLRKAELRNLRQDPVFGRNVSQNGSATANGESLLFHGMGVLVTKTLVTIGNMSMPTNAITSVYVKRIPHGGARFFAYVFGVIIILSAFGSMSVGQLRVGIFTFIAGSIFIVAGFMTNKNPTYELLITTSGGQIGRIFAITADDLRDVHWAITSAIQQRG